MKFLITILFSFILIGFFSNCKTARHINKALSPKDTLNIALPPATADDSVLMVKETLQRLSQNYIDFKTFNAKIKVEYVDSKGKQPDVTAVVRIVKDSAIWVSLSASILNFEVYRMLITKDSVCLMDKREKEYTLRSINYLQEISQIPFDFTTLQNLLVGNPIFMDGDIVSFKRTESHSLITLVGKYFKHLLTLSANNHLVVNSKLDDVDLVRSRTAYISYDDFENKAGVNFSTFREIVVSEKNKLDIKMNYKQYEFNKNLSVILSIPKNYKRR